MRSQLRISRPPSKEIGGAVIRPPPVVFSAAQWNGVRLARLWGDARSVAECSSPAVVPGGGVERSRGRPPAKGGGRFNSLAPWAALSLRFCAHFATSEIVVSAHNLRDSVGRPSESGHGRGTGRLLAAQFTSREPTVKLLFKHARGRRRAAAFRTYEPQLVG